MRRIALSLVCLSLGGCMTYPNHAVTSSINPTQLRDFNKYPPATQQLIHEALDLTKKHLTYSFGSANPESRGMDCSGAIYYLLHKQHMQTVPRTSDQLYKWIADAGHMHHVHAYDVTSKQFASLKPGDLLFWSGTYHVKRKIPVTHVMMYLGKNKKGEPLIFGSSNGQPYQGKRMRGVSVFDFTLPERGDKVKFVGYGCIPSLTCA